MARGVGYEELIALIFFFSRLRTWHLHLWRLSRASNTAK